ncbi:2291_t:CDS:1, partial [Ambispora leptoticha]
EGLNLLSFSSELLDIPQELSKKLELKLEDSFYVRKEVLERKEIERAITIENETEICLQRLLTEESNKGKIIGTASGIGTGAAGGAAAGAGLMVLAAPYTFGLSLSLVPVAATAGAIAGGLGGGTTGFMTGALVDKFSNSEIVKIKKEIKGFLEDYKKMVEEKSHDCQEESMKEQKENYDNEVRELTAYIENSNN